MSSRAEMLEVLELTHEEGMVRRNESIIEQIYADDFVNESPGLPDALRYGPAGIHQEYRFLWSAFSDMSITHEEIVVEGDFLGVRWWWQARHTGPFLGFQATGATIRIEGYDILEIRDRKIRRAWVYQDNAAIMQQLQAAARQTAQPSSVSYAFSDEKPV